MARRARCHAHVKHAVALVVMCGAATAFMVVNETNLAVDAPLVTGERMPARTAAGQLISADYVTSDVGCLRDRSAAALEEFFSAPAGPVIGHDSTRMVPLGGDRYLWFVQDPFIDYRGVAVSMAQAEYTNSAVFLQEGLCLTLVAGGTVEDPRSFEPGLGETFEDFYWPGGGSIDGGLLRMIWIRIHRDGPQADPMDGPAIHPVSTWMATYDAATLQRLSFDPAPNPGVQPIYGFDVVDDGGYSYMFGNSFASNLSLEGGYANGPHTATVMWLARVPRGQLQQQPEYRTADGWSTEATDARPISQQFWTENQLRPVKIDDAWIGVTKVDGFIGSDVTVSTAPEAWGPWTQVVSQPSAARGSGIDMVTYAPMPLPWLDADGSLIVGMSQIDTKWESHNGGDPSRYRPHYFAIPLPQD